MKNPVEEKIHRWATEASIADGYDARDAIMEIGRRIDYFVLGCIRTMNRAFRPTQSFSARLRRWLENVDADADQQTLFRLVPEIYYVGGDEFHALYRAAYRGPIARWLIDQIGMSFDVPNAEAQLETAAAQTWFCPITDSMRINAFFHVNNIPGEIDHRPDWRTLQQFGSAAKLLNYIEDNHIKRLVLLEDFIATGTQAKKAIEFASAIRPADPIPVLVVPLIICPKATETFANLQLPSHVVIDPVLHLPKKAFITEVPETGEALLHASVRDFAHKTYSAVTGPKHNAAKKPYGPLGYQSTGGLIVMYSNTPDNTLPLIHWRSDSWQPLFPRHSRVYTGADYE